MKESGVYGIINLKNNKIYVGSSVDMQNRRIHHFCDLRCNRHANTHLQSAFNLDGEQNFQFVVLEKSSPDCLFQREQYWMDYHKSYDDNFGYNFSLFANRPTPWRFKKYHSEETKVKMRLTKLGKTFSEKHKCNLKLAQKKLYANGYVNPNKGKKVSEIERERLSKLRLGIPSHNKGKRLSPESIAKRTATRRENNNGRY